MLFELGASAQILGVQGPDPVVTVDLQVPSSAVNLLHYSSVPVNDEQFLGYVTHPFPLVTQIGVVPELGVKNLLHSSSVVAVEL